jgi:hypothetical protein
MAGVIGALPTINVAGDTPIQTLRQFDRMSGKLTYRYRGRSPFYHELKARAQKRAVTDYKYQHYETEKFTREGSLRGDDGAGNAAALTVSVQFIYIAGSENFLQSGDVIHSSANQTNQATAVGTVFMEGEQIVIVQTKYNDVTGVCLVQRNGGAGTNAANVTTTTAAHTLKWAKTGSASREGSTRRTALMDTVGEDYQYIQTFRESFDFTTEMLSTKMYINERQRVARTKLMSINEDIDLAFWTGKYRKVYEDGKPKRYMGGVFGYLNDTFMNSAGDNVVTWSTTTDLVTGDGTSRIYYVNAELGETMLWKFLEKAFINGDVANKVAWCGPSFPTELQILLGAKLRLEPGETKYGTAVMKWIHPRIPTGLPLIVEPNWYNLYDNDLVILDMDNIEYNYVVWGGPAPFVGPSDLRHIKYTGNDSEGTMAEKNEYVAAVGVNPMAKPNHSWMTYITASSV